MRIYVDMDETLIGNILDQEGNVVNIVRRPGADWFLRILSHHGDLWLLTAANWLHAQRGLRLLDPHGNVFKGVITREMMSPIEEQVDRIMRLPYEDRSDRLSRIEPIAKPGVIFDDSDIGTQIWAMKSKAVGADESKWITVEAFGPGRPDRQGLKKAYSEFVARFGGQGGSLGRTRLKMVKVWH